MDQSLEAFVKFCQKTAKQVVRVEEFEGLAKIEKQKLAGMEEEVLKMMQASGIEKQDVPGFGTFSVQKKHSGKVPKTLEEKKALFGYILEAHGQDVLDDYLTVNSARINSLWKEDYALAIARGDIDWKMPGIPEPTPYFRLGKRKK